MAGIYAYQIFTRPLRAWTRLVFLFGFGLLIVTRPGFSQDIFFNRVSPPAGKSFLHITGMIQDKQGYMWFASKNGLFRYDGYQMIHFKNNPLDPNSLATDELESICMDPSGMIWIGTFNAGLDRLDPATGIFTHYRHDPKDPQSLSSDTISAVYADREGMVWVAVGDRGLDRLEIRTKTITHYRSNPGDPSSLSSNIVRAIYEDRQRRLWIGTGSVYGKSGGIPEDGGLNLLERETGKFTRYKHDPANPGSLVNNKVRAIYEDSKGNFWVGTAGDGLHRMNRVTGTFERFHTVPSRPVTGKPQPVKKTIPYDHITFIQEDTTGALWIGTAESGLNYYNPATNKTQLFKSAKDTAGSYADYTAWWACTSREGILWISSLHGSLYRVNPLRVNIPFYPVDGYGLTALLEDPDGSTWMGTGHEGFLFHLDAQGKVLKKYLHEPGNPKSISSNEVSCMNFDQEGNLWVGTFGGGLNMLDKKTGGFTRYLHEAGNKPGLSNNIITSILPGSENELWVGTFSGLNRLNKKTGESRRYLFNPAEDPYLGTNIVTSVLKDLQGTWWAGTWTKGGIHRFDPSSGKYKSYLKGASITRIYEDRSGMLWAGCSEGLFWYDRKQDAFNRFEDPLFLTESSEVRNLLEDNEGDLWITTTKGIIRINRERRETTLFGKNYGINGSELFFLAAYKTKNGKLYFGSSSGYYSFFPAEITRGMKAPELVISAFRVANQLIRPGPGKPLEEPVNDAGKIHLAYNQNIFSFEFAGLDFSNPEDNRHLFMLENYDAGWNLAESERKAIYFNVPPGKYVFRVKMVNSYGVWTEKSINLVITPPWWTSWWFRGAAILVLAGLLYAIIRWRVRQKFRRRLEQSERDKQLAELRQKTGELEMQALRAQMNPHFVFNSLNAINRFILQNNKAQASEYLTKFSRLVRMILQNSQSTLISLESELDSLKLYLELEALRFDHRFEYKVTVPKDLDIDLLKVPPLIIQPYAENAIWHGLMHKEEKGHLDIEIRQEPEHLLISIKDDGIGRQQSAAMTSKSATRHKSMGLKITADRISMLQRSSDRSSAVVINDLVNADGSAAGTEVIIKIPVIYDQSDLG